MKDIITKLTFTLGKIMSLNETNELCESIVKKSRAGWKFNIVKDLIKKGLKIKTKKVAKH